MKRVIVSGKLLDGFMNMVAKGFGAMMKDMKFKAKPEEVEVDGQPGVKYIIQVEEVEPKYLKKGIKNKKTGRMSGNVDVTICRIPNQENKVIVLIEPDPKHFNNQLKKITSKPLSKGEVSKFFDKWLEKHMLYVATDEEGREEILDENDVDNEGAADNFKAASTDVQTLSIMCAKQYRCFIKNNRTSEIEAVNSILSNYCRVEDVSINAFTKLNDSDMTSVMKLLQLK